MESYHLLVFKRAFSIVMVIAITVLECLSIFTLVNPVLKTILIVFGYLSSGLFASLLHFDPFTKENTSISTCFTGTIFGFFTLIYMAINGKLPRKFTGVP